MKKILSVIFVFLALFSVSAESKILKYSDYYLTAYYPDSVQPGDAVFIRLNFECNNRKTIKNLKDDIVESANLEIYRLLENKNPSEKPASKSKFYVIEKSKRKRLAQTVMLSGAPLSTYLKTGDYVAKINFCVFGKSEESLSIPIKIIEKEFISETIPLNASNTAIKTNTSKERQDQIERLNKILATKNYDSVYETKRFIAPNPATRRTSFFGDRRVFAYNNGKSSTSLHYGIDYGIPTGSEVRSCGRGRVVMAENRISTGWSICIEHLPGLYSLYYHMDEMKAKVGQMVEQGDLIGLSGCTGLATGPHLHWEIRLNMEAISPDFMCGDFAFNED